MSSVITTKYGNARVDDVGYYSIINIKEGFKDRRLHRLIYEDSHKVTILPGNHIHHKDGNKLNNEINNLELLTHSEHSKIHRADKIGENAPHYGKKHSEEAKIKMSKSQTGRKHTAETRDKISKSHKGKIISEETRKKIGEKLRSRECSFEERLRKSKVSNTSGIMNVCIKKDSRTRSGLVCSYQQKIKGKKNVHISATTLDVLKERVIAKGFDWIELEAI